MKKLVIVINGAGGVGKDTLVGAVAEKYETRNISSVDPIKELARQAGWTGEKDDKSRKMLSDLKALFTEYNDLSLSYVKSQYEQFLKSDEQVMFVHIREPEEIARFVTVAPERVKTLLITSPRAATNYGNDSDDRVQEYKYDMLYHNHLPLDGAGLDFLRCFDLWFERYAFETDGTEKTLTATYKNGFWSAAITTKCSSGNSVETIIPKCSISITSYVTGKNDVILTVISRDAATI